MLLDSYFLFLASPGVVRNTSSMCAAVKNCDEPEIRDTTGMLGCGKGSSFGHFSSSGSSETCRTLGKNRVYVHCTLVKLSRWMDKVLLLFNLSLHSQHTMGRTFPLQNVGAISWIMKLYACTLGENSGTGGGNTHRAIAVLWANVTSTTPKVCDPKDANGWTVQGRKIMRQKDQRNSQQQTQCSIFGLFFFLLNSKLVENAFLGQGFLQIWNKK